MRGVTLSLIIAGLFLFAILIYLMYDVDVIFKSSSEQSDINVVVDGDAPIIRIFSPKNINYEANIDILVNYSVIDQSLNSVWYSLNGGNNISINGNFFLNLAEGNYLLKIYANDSFGRNNFSEVSFSVNNSLLFCGDNTCSSNIGESCNNCPGDCGVCTSGTGGGEGEVGGGGGGIVEGNNSANLPVADIINVTDNPELQRIKIEDDVKFVSVINSERIILDVGDGQEYGISFSISDEGIKLEASGVEYNLFDKGIISVKTGDKKVYVGVYELNKNNAILAMGTNEDNVKLEIGKLEEKGASRTRIVYFLIGIVIVLILAVVSLIAYSIFKNKRTSEEEEKSSEE